MIRVYRYPNGAVTQRGTNVVLTGGRFQVSLRWMPEGDRYGFSKSKSFTVAATLTRNPR